MVTCSNHVIAGPDLHRARPLALSRFSQHLFAKYNFSSGPLAGTQARSQKLAMGGCLGGGAPSCRRPMGVCGRSPQLPEAGGQGEKPPAAGGMGVWERSPKRSKIFLFFCKNNLILEIV